MSWFVVGVLVASSLVSFLDAECITVVGRLVCDRKPQAVSGVTIYMYDFETQDIFNWAVRGQDTLMATNTTDIYGRYYLTGCTLDMDMGLGQDPPDPYFQFQHFCNERPQTYEKWVEQPNFTPGAFTYRDIVLDGIPDLALETRLHQWMGNP